MTARALVVGVPTTSVTRLRELPLLGAKADAERMGELLDRRGFNEVDVRSSGVGVDEFKALVVGLRARTKSGDLGLLYISGHGYSTPTHDPNDPDGFDECLVLSDEVLTDNWFRSAFWPGVNEGSRWITCADTCFSATVMIGVKYVKVNEAVVTPMKNVKPEGIARISLAAAGENEFAQQVARGKQISSWYTTQILSLIAADPSLTYGQLWRSMDARWRQESQTIHALGRPWMARSEAAGDLNVIPAFAAPDFRPAGG